MSSLENLKFQLKFLLERIKGKQEQLENLKRKVEQLQKQIDQLERGIEKDVRSFSELGIPSLEAKGEKPYTAKEVESRTRKRQEVKQLKDDLVKSYAEESSAFTSILNAFQDL